jgi:hypothetical protein
VLSKKLADSTPPERIEFLLSPLRRLIIWCVGALWGAFVGALGSSLLLFLSTEMTVEESLLASASFFLSDAFFLMVGFLWVAIIGVLLLIRLISPQHGRLVFYEDKVRGLALRAPWREVEFPLSQLDRAQSCSRGPYQRLSGYQVLYSVNGEKIYWERASFEKEAVAEVLDQLRCD